MEISFDILGVGSAQAVFVQSELLLRIAIACILGIFIGNERKNRNKSAGVRTHAIVAMGSALMMVVSKYGFADIAELGKFDGSRIAAQVVSGVGFLGAGIIFVRNNLVSGLTTSAGIWATAGVGMAMGAGLYVIGIASALMIILTQKITHKIAHFADVALGGTIWITVVQEEGAVKKIEDFLEQRKVEITSTKIRKNKKDEIKLEFEVIYPPGFDKSSLLSSLAEEKNIMTINE